MKTHSLRMLFATLSALPFLSPLAAQSLTGRVVSPTGQPIPGIDVDPGSGNPVGTTDALGIFSITPLPADEYDLEYLPPIGSPWAARMIVTNVAGATNVGDIVLQPGFALSGIARNGAGAGLPSCNVNVYSQSGEKLFTPHDGTDLAGNFSVTIPAGTWDVRVLPPVGAPLVPAQLEDLVVTTATSLGIVTLPNGYAVSGTVNDQQTLVPVGQTRIKATNALTGQRVVLTTETANTFGQFSVLLPIGMFDLDFEPPIGNTHVGRRKYGVLVSGALGLGQVKLKNGVLVSGTVTSPSGVLAGADIDVFDGFGTKLWTPRDITSAAGTFSIAVPAGSGYVVRVQPPVGAGLVGVTVGPTAFGGTTNLGTIALPAGTPVRGHVVGSGIAEAGAEFVFFDPTGAEVAVAGNRTDDLGTVATNLQLGHHGVLLQPAEGSFHRPARGELEVASNKAVIRFVLQPKRLRCTLSSPGTPTLPQGGTMLADLLIDNRTGSPLATTMDLLLATPSGGELPILMGAPLVAPTVQLPITGLPVPLPPIPTADLGKVLRLIVRFRDGTTSAILDTASTELVVE